MSSSPKMMFCSSCDKQFATREELIDHESQCAYHLYPNNTEKLCEDCNERFSTEDSYLQHKRDCHGEELSETNSKSLHCEKIESLDSTLKASNDDEIAVNEVTSTSDEFREIRKKIEDLTLSKIDNSPKKSSSEEKPEDYREYLEYKRISDSSSDKESLNGTVNKSQNENSSRVDSSEGSPNATKDDNSLQTEPKKNTNSSEEEPEFYVPLLFE